KRLLGNSQRAHIIFKRLVSFPQVANGTRDHAQRYGDLGVLRAIDALEDGECLSSICERRVVLTLAPQKPAAVLQQECHHRLWIPDPLEGRRRLLGIERRRFMPPLNTRYRYEQDPGACGKLVVPTTFGRHACINQCLLSGATIATSMLDDPQQIKRLPV